MYGDECAKQAEVGYETRIRRVDIKTELTSEAAHLKKQIQEYTERLRIVNEKYRLVNKNKDLEAYLNLTR